MPSFNSDAFARLVGDATASILTQVDGQVVLIEAGDTVEIVVPKGETGFLEAKFSYYAWLTSALLFGGEQYLSIAGKLPGEDKLDTANEVLRALAFGGDAPAGAVGELDAIRDCWAGAVESFGDLRAELEPGQSNLAFDLFTFGLDCLPSVFEFLGDDGGLFTGIVRRGWLEVAAIFLTGFELLSSIFREIYDEIMSAAGDERTTTEVLVEFEGENLPAEQLPAHWMITEPAAATYRELLAAAQEGEIFELERLASRNDAFEATKLDIEPASPSILWEIDIGQYGRPLSDMAGLFANVLRAEPRRDEFVELFPGEFGTTYTWSLNEFETAVVVIDENGNWTYGGIIGD